MIRKLERIYMYNINDSQKIKKDMIVMLNNK